MDGNAGTLADILALLYFSSRNDVMKGFRSCFQSQSSLCEGNVVCAPCDRAPRSCADGSAARANEGG